jgi:hypothetical protein
VAVDAVEVELLVDLDQRLPGLGVARVCFQKVTASSWQSAQASVPT